MKKAKITANEIPTTKNKIGFNSSKKALLQAEIFVKNSVGVGKLINANMFFKRRREPQGEPPIFDL
jgi:hypothetical protein